MTPHQGACRNRGTRREWGKFGVDPNTVELVVRVTDGR